MSNDAGDISEAMNCVNAGYDEVRIQGRDCSYVYEMTVSINWLARKAERDRQTETRTETEPESVG